MKSSIKFRKPKRTSVWVGIGLPPAAILGAIAIAFACCIAGAQESQPATGAAAISGDPLNTTTQERTLFELFQAGGPFMYALLACSVFAVTIIIERFITLRRRYVIQPGFMAGLKGVFRDRQEDQRAALEYCRGNDSSLARVAASGIRRLPRGVASAEKAMEDAGANEAMKLRRNIRLLYAIGSVATLLGLIGTISGMIKAFQVASGGGMGKSELLAKGIYEAMVCTFGGLAVAIVCTAFYYYFLGRVERLVVDMNDALAEFGDRYLAAPTEGEEEMEPVTAGR